MKAARKTSRDAFERSPGDLAKKLDRALKKDLKRDEPVADPAA